MHCVGAKYVAKLVSVIMYPVPGGSTKCESMSFPYSFALLAACLAALVNAAGLFIARRFGLWTQQHGDLFLSFAAGLLLAAWALHLAPEAMAGGTSALIWGVAGFCVLWGAEKAVCAWGISGVGRGGVALSAIAVHSFVDGLVYDFSFQHGVQTGALSASGLVAHELPEAMAAYWLLRGDGHTADRAFWLALFATGLTTPLGTLAGLPFVVHGQELSFLLALAAGALAFVLAKHMAPVLIAARANWLPFGAGLAVSVTAVAVVPH